MPHVFFIDFELRHPQDEFTTRHPGPQRSTPAPQKPSGYNPHHPTNLWLNLHAHSISTPIPPPSASLKPQLRQRQNEQQCNDPQTRHVGIEHEPSPPAAALSAPSQPSQPPTRVLQAHNVGVESRACPAQHVLLGVQRGPEVGARGFQCAREREQRVC